MSPDPNRQDALDIYGGAHDVARGVPAYQYARIKLTPADPLDAPVIIHACSSSVRRSVAESIDERLSKDVADGGTLYSPAPYIRPTSLERFKPAISALKPFLTKLLRLSGPPHQLGAGALSAEPVRLDMSPAADHLMDDLDKITGSKPGLKRFFLKGAIRGVTIVLPFSKKFTTSITDHSRVFMLNPSFREDPLSDDSGEESALSSLSRQSCIATAESVRELGRISPGTPVVLFSSSPDTAAWSAAHFREQGYQFETEAFAPEDGQHLVKGDMVKPSIRRSHGDNDDSHSPIPEDVMSMF